MFLQGPWSWKTLVTLCALESFLSGSSHGLSSNLMLRSSCHTLCKWMAYLSSEFPHVPSKGQLLRSSWHTFKQLKSLSPVSVHSCFFKLRAWENVFLQLKHWNNVSSVWVPSWVFKWYTFEKFLAHLERLNRERIWYMWCSTCSQRCLRESVISKKGVKITNRWHL